MVYDKRTTVWWPLFASQHLVLAGAAEGPLTSFVQQVQQRISSKPQPLLVHDPDGRLRGLNDVLAAVPTHPDALAEARRLQLAGRFAATRTAAHPDSPVPICIVVAPSEELWSDLQPLLIPDSGMQVILVLGDRPPLAALRTVCHQCAVIETPDSRHAPLPDAFRPAALPAARDGQTLAWQHGGQSSWRGRSIGEGV